MALCALEGLTAGSTVVGVGAGLEVTTLLLGLEGHTVFPTDIYLGADSWAEPALVAFCINPNLVFPEADRRGIIPVHADARSLPFPDNFADGVFSSGSLEHFGNWEQIVQSFREMARILKPGGVLSVSTEFRLNGPQGKVTWDPSVYLFTRDKLEELVADTPELEWIGDRELITPERVLAQEEPTLLLPFLINEQAYLDGELDIYPNLLMSHEGFSFCSVHIALRKTVESEDASDSNRYARDIIQADSRRFMALTQGTGKERESSARSYLEAEVDLRSPLRLRERLRQDLQEVQMAGLFYGQTLPSRSQRLVSRVIAATASTALKLAGRVERRVYARRSS